MNCHMVSQCYLKAWKIPSTKKSIYVFKKNETIAYDNKSISNLSDTNFALEDKYIIDFHSKEYMHKFYDQFSTLIKEFDVTPLYNGQIIDSITAYFAYLDEIDEWIFKNNSSNKLIPSAEIESTWNGHFGKTIEKYLDKHLENKWHQIIDYTNTHIIKRSWKVQSKYKELLTEFAVVQLLRRYENMYKMGLDWLIGVLSETFTTSTSNFSQTIFDEKFKEALWLVQLYKHTQYQENPVKENENAISKCIDVINELYQPCFLIAPPKIKFITSDNPCYVVKTSELGLTSGIYFPITTNACLFLCNCKGTSPKTKYYILDICDRNVKYVNHLTKANSIQELAYFDEDISNMFSENIDWDSWRKMLEPLINDIEI